MRVTIWSINYAPEPTGTAVPNRLLALELKRLGHRPRVVTSFPYYPTWKKRKEDRYRLFRNDIIEDIPIHRCWHYVPKCTTPLKRMLHEASFVVTSCLRLLFLGKPDLLLVVSPPLGLGVAAPLIRLFKRCHIVVHVHNLQPDAAIDLGMLKPGKFTQLLVSLEQFTYRHANQVSSTSDGILRRIRKKGVPQEQTIYFPNPLPLKPTADPSLLGRFRKAHRIPKDTFLAVYSGSLSVKQGLEVLMAAAEVLEAEQEETRQKVQIVICGEGAQCDELESLALSRWITSILFLPLQPEEQYLDMLRDADCYLITQQHGAGGFSIPTKLLPALACGKAILSVADADSELVTDALVGEFGSVVPPGDGLALARELTRLAENPEEVRLKGKKALEFADRYDSKKIVEAFLRECKDAMTKHAWLPDEVDSTLATPKRLTT